MPYGTRPAEDGKHGGSLRPGFGRLMPIVMGGANPSRQPAVGIPKVAALGSKGFSTLLDASYQVIPKILVVEDDPVIADMLSELLMGAGYRVQWAPDVISALSALERLSIHLITLDIELGTYSGHGLLAFLKADPRTRHIPVIVVSSCQVGPDVRRLAEHVLSKPFSIGPLLQLVSATLERQPSRLEPWRDRAPEESLELEVAREVLD